ADYPVFGEREIVAAGHARRDAAGIGAVVDEDKPALGGLAQDRREGLLGRREARTHRSRDTDIALEAAHQPIEPFKILFGGERGQKRLGAGIVVRIVEGLHRRLQQYFVTGAARAPGKMIDVVAVRHEGKRDGAGQLADGLIADRGADAEAADDERNAWRVGLAGNRLHRLRISLRRAHAVAGDFRNGPLRGRLDQFLVVRGERSASRVWSARLVGPVAPTSPGWQPPDV